MTAQFNLESLLRADIKRMGTYTPIVPFDVLSLELGIPEEQLIKLDANENPYGASPLVRHAIAEAPYLHSYPDPESRKLRQALSDYTNVPMEYLMVGHGSDELIDMVMRLFLEPGDKIINCPPTFGMYKFDAQINSADIINVERLEDFSLDMTAIETATHDSQAKMIFIATPNNPDGSVISDDDLQKLLNLPIVVILDEAYAEFCGQSFITQVPTHPNLIVFRTFSKWAGLAGLRVGYGAFPIPIIDHLWKIKQPYNVNLAGQVAALASLADADRLLETVKKIVDTRQQLEDGLATIPWLIRYASEANFILCRVIDKDAAQVKAKLARKGILIRHYDTPRLADHIRFSIGTPDQISLLIAALQSL